MPWAIPHLKRRSDFLQAAREGASWSMPGLVLQMRQRTPQDTIGTDPASIAPDPAAQAIRVGFTTSRKVGGAVQRNRARRRLRALAEQILPVAGRPGCDYVLIGRPATVTRPFAALQSDFEAALARLHAGRGRSPGSWSPRNQPAAAARRRSRR